MCLSLVPPEAARVQDVLQSQTKELDKANKVANVYGNIMSCFNPISCKAMRNDRVN